MMLWLVLLFSVSPLHAVVSPLEKLSDDMKGMQETVNSIQASLMTSVGLIQDQVSEFSQRLTKQLEAKLVSLDKKLDSLSTNMIGLQEQMVGQWDGLQPHLQVLSSTASAIDKKVEQLSRLQRDQLSEHRRNAEFRQEGITRKMEEQNSQLQVLDSRLLDIQDKVSLLPNMNTALKNISSRHPFRHRGGGGGGGNSNANGGGQQHCQDTKELVEIMNAKLKVLVDRVTEAKLVSVTGDGPNFEYLRTDAVGNQEGVTITQDTSLEDLDFEDARIVSLIRKIVLPYKKTSKKLKEMETEQGRIETMIAEMENKLTESIEDMNRKFGDFKIVATDISQEQTQIIEGYGKTLAGILQCCKGHSVDYSRFIASAGPVIDRLDSWMVTWRGEVSQGMDRIQQQQSYNSGLLQDEHKELEKLLLEGLDSCRRAKDFEESANRSTILPRPTTTTTLRPFSLSPTTVITTTTTALATSTAAVEVSSTEAGLYMDCLDLLKAGFTENKVYRVGPQRQWNRAARDYNTRLCNMEADGGGWTVIQNRGDYGEPRVNFTASWQEYKDGFGELQGEFWWGNEFISQLSAERSFSLRVELEAWDGRRAYANYATFRLDDESSDYRLWIGGYSGNASDSLSVHNGYKFSTVDRNNDEAPKCCPCAPAYGGGWWFYSCFESNLNGEYFTDPKDNGYYRGIIWELWLGDYSLKRSRMMIRPTDFSPTQAAPPDP